MKYRNLIWDFNGTLLDDMGICIDAINVLLYERNLPLMTSHRYQEIFTFPVKEYYIKAGFRFDKEPFEIPAHQFIDHYRKALRNSKLHDGVTEVLALMKSRGYRQFILSAMEKEFLLETLNLHNIKVFFDNIYGIEDHLGHSKTEVASKPILENHLIPSECIIIGDTLHDWEVSTEISVPCILVSHGHQSETRLKAAGCPVMTSLEDVTDFICLRENESENDK